MGFQEFRPHGRAVRADIRKVHASAIVSFSIVIKQKSPVSRTKNVLSLSTAVEHPHVQLFMFGDGRPN